MARCARPAQPGSIRKTVRPWTSYCLGRRIATADPAPQGCWQRLPTGGSSKCVAGAVVAYSGRAEGTASSRCGSGAGRKAGRFPASPRQWQQGRWAGMSTAAITRYGSRVGERRKACGNSVLHQSLLDDGQFPTRTVRLPGNRSVVGALDDCGDAPAAAHPEPGSLATAKSTAARQVDEDTALMSISMTNKKSSFHASGFRWHPCQSPSAPLR